MGEPNIQVLQIVGDLPANQLSPTYPELEWHGKIKKIYNCLNMVEVEVLNEGYEGYDELIYFEQIIRVESIKQ